MTRPPAPPIHPSRSHPKPFAGRLRGIVRRPHMVLALLLFVALSAGLALLTDWSVPTIALTAWNFAGAVHLALTLHMMATSDAEATLRRARRLDATAGTILALSAAASSASLLAVFAELAVTRGLDGIGRGLHIALAAITVVTAWSFIQTIFAIHYAHLHAIAVADGADPGLRIPGETRPDYWDFLYVAVSIGTSGQTADVEFTGKGARRIALAHSTLAFFFNTTVLALAINIAAGLA